MFGNQIAIRPKPRDEAEKPFWISYADLMTALMVLFLASMAVALLTVTRTISEQERRKQEHNQDIQTLLDRFVAVTRKEPCIGLEIDRTRHIVSFGNQALFPDSKYSLTGDQAQLLRACVVEMLDKTTDAVGQRVFKEIIVDGHTSRRGTYLANLNLSLQRAQRVVCALFANPEPGEAPMTDAQRTMVREQVVVGGYSFKEAKDTEEASRRVELRLQFLDLDERRQERPGEAPPATGSCALGV